MKSNIHKQICSRYCLDTTDVYCTGYLRIHHICHAILDIITVSPILHHDITYDNVYNAGCCIMQSILPNLLTMCCKSVYAVDSVQQIFHFITKRLKTKFVYNTS